MMMVSRSREGIDRTKKPEEEEEAQWTKRSADMDKRVLQGHGR